MLQVLKIALKNKIVQTGILFLLGAGGGWWITKHTEHPKVIYTSIPNTKIVMVDKPVLTEKVITKIIVDPKERERLEAVMDKNSDLLAQVVEMNSTIAALEARGGTGSGGVITTEPLPEPSKPQEFVYKDYQLNAKYDSAGQWFNYTLDQKFHVVTETGYDRTGQKISKTDVFQVGPGSVVTPLTTETTTIFADERVPRWRVSPRIQGGLGVGTDGKASGVITLQVVKRGRSTATEDIVWAVLSPGGLFQGNKVTLGLLPVSFNLGSIKHNPLTNVWISPSIDLGKHFGVILSATF